MKINQRVIKKMKNQIVSQVKLKIKKFKVKAKVKKIA